MKIELTRGCTCDWLGIDGVSEVEMTDEQRQKYFKKILEMLPHLKPYDETGWFNSFLQWVCNTYGEYSCTDKPCECCGDYVETLEVNALPDFVKEYDMENPPTWFNGMKYDSIVYSDKEEAPRGMHCMYALILNGKVVAIGREDGNYAGGILAETERGVRDFLAACKTSRNKFQESLVEHLLEYDIEV